MTPEENLIRELEEWKREKGRIKKHYQRAKKKLRDSGERSELAEWMPQSIRITIHCPADWRKLNGAGPEESLVSITEHNIAEQMRRYKKSDAKKAWDKIQDGDLEGHVPYEYVGPEPSRVSVNKLTDQQVDLAVDANDWHNEAETKIIEDRNKAEAEAEDRWLRGKGRVKPSKTD